MFPQHLVPPNLLSDLHDVNVTAGDVIFFACNSTGFPPPTISWYKNNVTLTDNGELTPGGPSITSYTTGGTMTASQLYLEGVDLSDAGNYHCQSYNNLVKTLVDVSEVISLQVLSMPQHSYN